MKNKLIFLLFILAGFIVLLFVFHITSQKNISLTIPESTGSSETSEEISQYRELPDTDSNDISPESPDPFSDFYKQPDFEIIPLNEESNNI